MLELWEELAAPTDWGMFSWPGIPWEIWALSLLRRKIREKKRKINEKKRKIKEKKRRLEEDKRIKEKNREGIKKLMSEKKGE